MRPPMLVLLWRYFAAKRRRDAARAELARLSPCEHCGQPTPERYCDNDCRRVDKSGVGPCKVHGDDCPTIS